MSATIREENLGRPKQTDTVDSVLARPDPNPPVGLGCDSEPKTLFRPDWPSPKPVDIKVGLGGLSFLSGWPNRLCSKFPFRLLNSDRTGLGSPNSHF
ncbi:hypothetical protein L484_007154 [Morus notabilis]|uniref:Uncharacterized protein n=1 Tax=Morus notabilis TaxID=981085 RepID=W9S7D1_9ROSA|nr:hypothetical protein L484_007154 [Morus notabilis]